MHNGKPCAHIEVGVLAWHLMLSNANGFCMLSSKERVLMVVNGAVTIN